MHPCLVHGSCDCGCPDSHRIECTETLTVMDLPWLVTVTAPFHHRDLPGPFQVTWRHKRTGSYRTEHTITKVVCLTTGEEIKGWD